MKHPAGILVWFFLAWAPQVASQINANLQGPSGTQVIQPKSTITPRSLLKQPIQQTIPPGAPTPQQGSPSRDARLQEAKAFYAEWHASHPDGMDATEEQAGGVPTLAFGETNAEGNTSGEVIVAETHLVTPSGNAVPDNAIGVNPTGHKVTAINHRVQFFSANGQTLLDLPDVDFFTELGPDQLVFDPRVIHLPSLNRFVVMALHGTGSEHSKILVAISSSPDPMDPWHYYDFEGTVCAANGEENVWLDYPDLSATVTEIFISANVFSDNGIFLGSTILQLDILDGMQGNPMDMTLWCAPEVDGGVGKSLVPAPAVMQSDAHDIWFVSTHIPNSSWPTTDTFHYWHITAPQGESPALESFSVAIPDGPLMWGLPIEQPGGELLLVNDLRARSAFFHDGEIWLAMAASKEYVAGWCTIRTYKISTDEGTAQAALPLWQVGAAYSYPKILPWVEDVANWDGRCLVSFLKASSTAFPEVRAAMLSANMTWSPSMLIEAGTSEIDNFSYYNRWGDYIDAQIRLGQGAKEIWLHAHVGENDLYGNRIYKLVSDIPGCTDPNACNYDALATLDDGSCFETPCYGCMIEGACNYNPNADVSGVCLFSGCTNPFASNYSPFASCDDGSCCFSNHLTLYMTDSYGDGWNGATYTITNSAGDEIATGTMEGGSETTVSIGCSLGACMTIEVTGGIYPSEIGWEVRQTTSALLFLLGSSTTTLASGGANTTTSFVVGDGGEEAGCTDASACNFSAEAFCDDGSCCYDHCLAMHMTSTGQNGWFGSEFHWNIQNAETGTIEHSGRMDTYGLQIDSLCLSDGCYQVVYTPEDYLWNYIPIDLVFGEDTLVSGGSTLAVPPSFSLGNILPVESGGTGGCTDEEACNYNGDAICDNGSCCYGGCGSLHVLAPEGAMTHFAFDDGVSWTAFGAADTNFCFEPGCHNLVATGSAGGVWWLETPEGNYSGEVGIETTVFASGGGSAGCMDSMACNYDPEASCDDGACTFPACDDPAACNFSPNASCYGSFVCTYSCFGCTYATAINYDASATTDDGTCEFPNVEGPDCMGDLDADGVIGINDLLMLLGAYGDGCE